MKRDRRRYLVLCVHSEGPEPRAKSIFEELKRAVAELHGKQGLSLTLLTLTCEEPLIVRCSHRYVDLVRAGVAMLRQVEGRECMVHVARCSGSLKKALES